MRPAGVWVCCLSFVCGGHSRTEYPKRSSLSLSRERGKRAASGSRVVARKESRTFFLVLKLSSSEDDKTPPRGETHTHTYCVRRREEVFRSRNACLRERLEHVSGRERERERGAGCACGRVAHAARTPPLPRAAPRSRTAAAPRRAYPQRQYRFAFVSFFDSYLNRFRSPSWRRRRVFLKSHGPHESFESSRDRPDAQRQSPTTLYQNSSRRDSLKSSAFMGRRVARRALSLRDWRLRALRIRVSAV